MPRGVSETSPASAIDQVLAPSFLGHLGRMRLSVRHAFGPRPGETPVRGQIQSTGLELERHKPYEEGDELRFLDWNAYARLDQLLLRQFRAEREAPVHIFLDGSASMAAPETDGKFPFAVGLALALAYVAVRHHNPVRVVFVRQGAGSGRGYAASAAVRFPARFHRLAEFCARLRPGGPTLLEAAVAAYVQAQTYPGLALLISDFLLEARVARGVLDLLAGRGYEVAALRPVGPGERDPARLFHRARVHDVETGEEKIVRLTRENLARYTRALAEHVESLSRACADNEAVFALCDVAAGLEHCLFLQLPQLGLLR
jgi:uncharacterized protein (DUF58 family)